MRDALSLKPTYYEALRRLTLQLAGVRMGADHAFLVETRLADLARQEGFGSLDAMVEELFAVGQARLAIQVVSSLVERDSHFNRDPASFDTLFDHVLPELAQRRGGGRIDLLCHGCGSGQDVYSVAMRAQTEAAQEMMGATKLQISGVDYPSQALERGRAGRYTHFEVQRGLSVRDLIAHFTPDPATGSTDWIVADHLRQCVRFRDAHLLAGTQDIGSYHAVLFRGALPHYSQAARLRMLRGLTRLLRPFGYLVLGSSEDLGDMHIGLDKVAGRPGLYRRRDVPVEPAGKQPTDRTTFDGAKPRKSAAH